MPKIFASFFYRHNYTHVPLIVSFHMLINGAINVCYFAACIFYSVIKHL